MEILKKYFINSQLSKDGVVIEKETVNEIKKKYVNYSKSKPENIILEKPLGIFALADNYMGDYRIVTFHYVDFRWYPLQSAAKIMHKSNIEEWQDGKGFACTFAESPFRHSGDVLGMMRGDFRDCFNTIIEQEKKLQILFEGTVDVVIDDRLNKIRFKSGVGLESLTVVEKRTRERSMYVDLIFIN
jgi:hypothetical protein